MTFSKEEAMPRLHPSTIKHENGNSAIRAEHSRSMNGNKDFALRQAQCERYNSYFVEKRHIAMFKNNCARLRLNMREGEIHNAQA